MCGRFALQTPRSRIATRYFNLQLPVGDVHARYNITPGAQITSVLATSETPASFDFSHWGFRPPWAKEDAPTPINIRAEKAATSPYFRAAFAHRRCLIPANSWYEWQRIETGKQPYYITLKEPEPDEVVFFAGLWEPAGERVAAATEVSGTRVQIGIKGSWGSRSSDEGLAAVRDHRCQRSPSGS